MAAAQPFRSVRRLWLGTVPALFFFVFLVSPLCLCVQRISTTYRCICERPMATVNSLMAGISMAIAVKP